MSQVRPDRKITMSAEEDKLDAERYRKLRKAINTLCRLPTKFDEFIRITAGSNAAGIDAAVDEMLDYRIPFPYRHPTMKFRTESEVDSINCK